MKTIKYNDEFTAANGYPFFIPDPDPAAHVKARQDAEAKREEAEAKNKDSQNLPPVSWMQPRVEATFAQAVIWFADNIWHAVPVEKGGTKKHVSPSDAGHAYAVIKAFTAPKNGKVSLETAPYDWLTKALDSDEGTAAFHVTSAKVLERLQGSNVSDGTAKAEGEGTETPPE